MNNVKLYIHRRKDTNEVFYVGIGLKNRPFSKKHRNIHWHNIVNKFDYIIEILFDNLTWKKAFKLEIALIKKYGRKDLGLGNLVNKTDGGEGCYGFKHSEEYIKSMTGSNNRMFGKKYSKEERGAIAQKLRGNKNHFFGKTHSEETREILRQKAIEQFKDKSKIPNRIGVIDTETGTYYFSIQEASRAINMSAGRLTSRLNGKVKNDTTLIKESTTIKTIIK